MAISTVKPTSVNLLEVNDLKVHFPVQPGLFSRVRAHVKAVDGVSFALAAGGVNCGGVVAGCGRCLLR